MPGAVFMHQQPSWQGVQGEGVPAPSPNAAGDLWQFLLWYIVIGFVLPGLIYGGLRLGGLQFVFRSR
jgi:hypothetical protein